MSVSFHDWFSQLAGTKNTPHAWQSELAAATQCRSRLIRIPTGWGKTLGVLATWSWHRIARGDNAWPRRLIWCLPMRVLVEQTHAIIRDAFDRLGLLWEPTALHDEKVGVHLLMGGAAPDTNWTLHPEQPAVFVGTQDMMLSRALNRGYAAPSARWPLELGYTAQDALWVMDEVQLMDVGLATSAQLQAFLDDDATKGFRPRRTWWMSATLQPDWLRSVDTTEHHRRWVEAPIVVAQSHRRAGLGTIRKKLSTAAIPAKDARGFARLIAGHHAALTDGDYGKVTLVVCNTVARACETWAELQKLVDGSELELVHSRFRPEERAGWRARFLDRPACRPGVDRIIVATQVVEAGVDISAGCVITELAPWPSLVQRIGRCARYGGIGELHVIDRGRDDKTAAPYAVEELEGAWDALAKLEDVGVASLEDFEEALSDERRAALYPYAPSHLLLRRELDELFDTTPDLTGAQLDIGRFIRGGDDRDVQVFWHDVPLRAEGSKARGAPPRTYRPRRAELCSVPFLDVRNWLCGEESKSQRKPRLRANMRAWVWDWIDGEWQTATRAAILPGRIVCVAADCGGYDTARGFAPDARLAPVVPPVTLPESIEQQSQADDAEDAEDLSMSEWKTLACHGGEAATIARRIGEDVGLSCRLVEILELAARWHDLGKAHPVFQGAIRHPERPRRDDLAKAPSKAWLRPPGTYRTVDNRETRAGFRHELASALALFAVLERYAPEHPALLGPWRQVLELTEVAVPAAMATDPSEIERAVLACTAEEFDLLAYLVLAHHGKVRVALNASPKDQSYRPTDARGLPIRGVRDGDELPPITLQPGTRPIAALRLTLAPAALGLSPRTGRSWRERTLDLQEKYGPGALAWLEALLIAADRRASTLRTSDPELAPTGGDR